MAYQVLARTWRPQQFSDVVGQPATLQTLTNALEQQRLHHAYLFTGTRGVGKTTLARILAKCVNCEKGITATPCDTCASCVEIKQGRFVDLIEVDAASRTRVEETRELLDNVQYLPTRGRYKVYLIDEVHMLSNHSFNALLKTLEEPPAHVLFLLATTDPQKLPVTVLSRCLQFHLKHLSVQTITQQLAHILDKEKISYEDNALHFIAQAAKGSMRDGLSLLDQAIAYGQHSVQTTAVTQMLGLLSQQQLLPLLQALLAKDGRTLLALSEELALAGTGLQAVLGGLLHLFHQLSVLQLVPGSLTPQTPEDETLMQLAQQISPRDLQLFYQIGLLGQQELPFAPDEKIGFDMVLLRMLAFQPQLQPAVAQVPSMTQIKSSAPLQAPVATPTLQAEPIKEPVPIAISDWEALLPQLNLKGLSHILASHCALEKIEGSVVYLRIEAAQAPLFNPKQQTVLNEAFSRHFGKEIHVQILSCDEELATPSKLGQQRTHQQLQAAERALSVDPNVKTLLEHFDAVIEPGSIEAQENL